MIWISEPRVGSDRSVNFPPTKVSKTLPPEISSTAIDVPRYNTTVSIISELDIQLNIPRPCNYYIRSLSPVT